MEANHTPREDPVQSIANAVLYEGFMLYPYRKSSLKNRQRWNFGVLFPPAYCQQQQSGDSSFMHTECLFEGGDETQLSVQVRCLQLCGDEVVERKVSATALPVRHLRQWPHATAFSIPPLNGCLHISCIQLDDRDYKATVRITNTTPFDGQSRDEALASALLSTHILLAVENGSFYSMIDAPPELAGRANCQNQGAWPVLVGSEGARNQMLASPIILYDYPKVAAQSRGDLFDGTEIDEILTLRIRTLTREEKREVLSDERTATLLARAEQLKAEELARLHGTVYRPKVVTASIKPGDRVVLRPKRRSDILDIALAGRAATVSSVETDFDDNVHICVTVDDDPGKDLGLEGKPGHRFFFGADEVELIR